MAVELDVAVPPAPPWAVPLAPPPAPPVALAGFALTVLAPVRLSVADAVPPAPPAAPRPYPPPPPKAVLEPFRVAEVEVGLAVTSLNVNADVALPALPPAPVEPDPILPPAPPTAPWFSARVPPFDVPETALVSVLEAPAPPVAPA